MEPRRSAPVPPGTDSRCLLGRYGWATFLFYLGAFLYYLYVRIRYTISGLGAGYEVYGIALLIVECLGASTIILFGIQMLWDPLHEKYPEDPNRPGVPQVGFRELQDSRISLLRGKCPPH